MSISRARRPLHWIICFALLLLLPVPLRASGEYRTVDVEGLKIIFDSEWASRTAPGYLPVRLDITNTGEARIIDIVSEGARFFRTIRSSGQPGGEHVRQSLRLARGDRVRLTLPVPIFADSENVRFEIQEDGRTLERFSYTGFQSGVPASDAAALIVADPATEFGARAKAWARAASGPPLRATGPGPRSSALDLVLEPARLPANWLGYTSVRAVIIGPKEWEQLNDAQKDALVTWTACGGDLFFADGDVAALFAGRRPPPAAPPGAARAYLFGRIHTPTSASIDADGLPAVLAASDKVQDANWALPANRARDWALIAARGFRLPIPGVNGVPARAYLTILILFALLIGPANYWLLWRRRQQVLFVLTAPLISAVFILLLAGYVLAGEGLAISGRAVTFTMIDQAAKQAVTRASLSLYAAGMTPVGGLRFPRDVAIYPIGPEGLGNRDTQVLDLTESQRFSSGVIHARAPTNLEQIAFRPARERVAVTVEGGTPSVVNGLGATIVKLFYRTGGRTYILSQPLPEGGRQLLKAGVADAPAVVPADVPLSSRLVHLLEHQPEGSYLAVLDRSPFWDPGVPHIVEQRSFHLVLGWPGGQP